MTIAGLQKMTLLDFPGKVACTVFLQGCNFRCPFCHNSDLLEGPPPTPLSADALLAFLEKRVGLLDGVCITGGEPTLQNDLPDLLARIKALGFAVKLDTNGTRPQLLKRLVADGLVDYVAMDVKNAPSHYAATVGLSSMTLDAVEESLRFLLTGAVAYELRTTVVAELHDENTVRAIGEWLCTLSPRKADRFFLQAYVERDSVLCGGLSAPDPATMHAYAAVLRPFVTYVDVRGVD